MCATLGAPYRRRGAMVVPSGIAQAFPGRSHLAIHGQIGPSRHHHCTAHSAAEPPRVSSTLSEKGGRTFEFSKERRDRVGPSRTVFGQGWPNVEPTWTYSWRVLDGPTRSRCGLSGETAPGRHHHRLPDSKSHTIEHQRYLKSANNDTADALKSSTTRLPARNPRRAWLRAVMRAWIDCRSQRHSTSTPESCAVSAVMRAGS